MTRAQRLSGRRRFEAVRRHGVIGRGDMVRARAISSGDWARSRAGIAVHGSRSAVIRNRARRRLRAVLATALLEHPGWLVVMSAPAREVAAAPYRDLSADVGSALARVASRLGDGAG